MNALPLPPVDTPCPPTPPKSRLDFIHHEAVIEQAWAERGTVGSSERVESVLSEVMDALADGTLRAADQSSPGHWQAYTWLMRAAVLSLRGHGCLLQKAGDRRFFDQPDKFHAVSDAAFAEQGWRVMAPTAVRRGVFLGKRVFMVPCFINSGAYIDDDSLIDGWANIGSCAQIGKRVHISTCVGIGGVAEPMQARPVIIEDDCFIGANSSIVEGVIVERGSVIGTGVHLGASTKIYDRETKQVTYGRIPAGSVVVPGALPSADGSHSIACAVIVKRVDAGTLQKIAINDTLRT